MKKCDIMAALKSLRPRSAWDRGVLAYAMDILADLPDDLPDDRRELTKALLNGANN